MTTSVKIAWTLFIAAIFVASSVLAQTAPTIEASTNASRKAGDPAANVADGAAERLQQIESQCAEASKEFVAAYREMQRDLPKDDLKRWIAENEPSPKYARQCLELADNNRGTKVGLMSLRFVCSCGYSSLADGLVDLKQQAIERLKRDYVPKEWFWSFVPTLAREIRLVDPVPFLRYCRESAPHDRTQGMASYELARRLRNESRRRQLSDEEHREATDLLQTCIAKFGDLPTERTTVAKAAAQDLYELKYLAIGQPAPETIGKDPDGESLRLSDFRGKVVVVSFWGDWCFACRRTRAADKATIEKFKDASFIWLGVNSDPLEKAREAVRDYKKPWRTFWDGGDSNGPIAQQWNVTQWPTTYVIDAEGDIRHKYSDTNSRRKLDRAVANLLRETANDPRKPKAKSFSPSAARGRDGKTSGNSTVKETKLDGSD